MPTPIRAPAFQRLVQVLLAFRPAVLLRILYQLCGRRPLSQAVMDAWREGTCV